ncbi:MAG: prepilin-type N-terminal cleavage/methylation domain-containing protein [Verrucomicrobiota bacterium]|nr:prepilin-type N-terminal cleavage/methylation domain-containing protein [Verrucomicrobiota bacterium]
METSGFTLVELLVTLAAAALLATVAAGIYPAALQGRSGGKLPLQPPPTGRRQPRLCP